MASRYANKQLRRLIETDYSSHEPVLQKTCISIQVFGPHLLHVVVLFAKVQQLYKAHLPRSKALSL